MAEILRFVTVDRNETEGLYEFETEREAREACGPDEAVIMRTYEYTDSELVWTPDGSGVWPPRDEPEQSEPMDYDAARDFAREDEER